MRLDPRHLIQFATVIEEGSFTRAAEVLGIAQPALSKTISYLEDRAGQSLFVRRRRPVEPSDLGRMLALRGIQIRSILAEAEQAAGLIARGQLGTLRIGAPPFFSDEVLPQIVTGFHVANPGVGFDMVLAYAPDLRAMVAERKLDLALVPMESVLSVPGLRQMPLADIDHAIVARTAALPAPGQSLQAALADGLWINHSPRSVLRTHTHIALSTMGITQARSIATSESGSAVLGILLAIDSLAVLPVISVLPQLRSGEVGIVAPMAGQPGLPFGLVSHGASDGTPLIDAFQGFARSVLARLAAEGQAFIAAARPEDPAGG